MGVLTSCYSADGNLERGFGSALDDMQEGLAVARRAWRGACFVFLEAGEHIRPDRDLFDGAIKAGSGIETGPRFAIFDVRSAGKEAWFPTHRDLLADDWITINPQANGIQEGMTFGRGMGF